MLNYNSKENLLLNLQSNNAVATMLYKNKWLRKEMMTLLKNFREETGKMPREKYKTVLEVLFDMKGKEEISKYYFDSYNIKNLKKG